MESIGRVKLISPQHWSSRTLWAVSLLLLIDACASQVGSYCISRLLRSEIFVPALEALAAHVGLVLLAWRGYSSSRSKIVRYALIVLPLCFMALFRVTAKHLAEYQLDRMETALQHGFALNDPYLRWDDTASFTAYNACTPPKSVSVFLKFTDVSYQLEVQCATGNRLHFRVFVDSPFQIVFRLEK